MNVENSNLLDSQAQRVAVVFPGQGSQQVGMLQELAEDYPQIKQQFELASNALEFDLWQICQDEEKLSQTQYTQPAVLTASMAIWQILKDEIDIKPLYLAGHSLGEYSALCASGVIKFEDAVKLVHKRGLLMQEAVEGKETLMAAVLGLEDDQVINLCQQIVDLYDEASVNAANFNSPGQVVVAGNEYGVTKLLEQVKNNMGKKAIPLKVSVPSHCDLMLPAVSTLEKELTNIVLDSPSIPVIQNRNAVVETNMDDMVTAMVEQLNNPVLWSSTMQNLANKHIDVIIECGNGNVLSNLSKRQTQKILTLPTDKHDRLEQIFEVFS